MFKVKLKGRQPIHPLQTIRRSTNSSSIIHQAPITAEAAPVRAKRATDRMATLTITSTQAGASKVRPGPWASRVQAERRPVQTRSGILRVPFRDGSVGHLFDRSPQPWHFCILDDFLSSKFIFLRPHKFGIFPHNGGRAFRFFPLFFLLLFFFFLPLLLFSRQSWVALDIGVCECECE